jgi:hypothetical protein
VNFVVYEQGGPLEHTITATGAGTGYGRETNGGETKAPHDATIPDSGNRGISGLAREFHTKHFKKNNPANESSA